MKNKLVLGTVQLGLEYGINNTTGKLSRQEVFDLLMLAKSSGISTLDTADHYGDSQALIGEFHRSSNEKFQINTKFKYYQGIDLKQHATDTLKLLSVSSIDVYFYHRFLDLTEFPGIKNDLSKLKDEGKIRKIGVSVYTNEEFQIAYNTPEIDVIQLPFNLLDNRTARGQHLELAKNKGKLLQARSVFLQGLFFKSPDTFPPYLKPLVKYIRKIDDVSREMDMTIENICLSYVLSQPEIDQVVIGVDSREQLIRNVSFAGYRMDERTVHRIDDIRVLETDLLYPTNWK